LNTEISCDDRAAKMKLPALLLQPIMENAIKFGLYDTTEDVMIKLKAEESDRLLTLSVENPFDPETAQPQKGTGFGLMSVQRRLFLLFGRNDLLETSSSDHTFITTVKIPQTS
jgi:LytS/YehU family sensor histidine kinase